MKLIAIELTSDVANPVPVLVEEDMESDPVGVKSAESGHPAPPLKHLPLSLDIPRSQTMLLDGIA